MIAQSIRDDDTGQASQEAFDKYKAAAIPYVTRDAKRAQVDVAKALEEEFARGPMNIRPLTPSDTVRSRLGSVVNSLKQPPIGWKGGRAQ